MVDSNRNKTERKLLPLILYLSKKTQLNLENFAPKNPIQITKYVRSENHRQPVERRSQVCVIRFCLSNCDNVHPCLCAGSAQG